VAEKIIDNWISRGEDDLSLLISRLLSEGRDSEVQSVLYDIDCRYQLYPV